MPKENLPMETIFRIVISTETSTDLADTYGLTYQKVAKLRRNKKYQQWWHLRRQPHNDNSQEVSTNVCTVSA